MPERMIISSCKPPAAPLQCAFLAARLPLTAGELE